MEERRILHSEWREPLQPFETKTKLRHVRWDVVGVSVGIIGLAVALSLGVHNSALIGSWSGAAVSLSLAMRRRKADEPVMDLMDLPSDVPQFPVDVSFTIGLQSKRDSGVITFVDGLMLYQGLRTSFTLTNADLAAVQGARMKTNCVLRVFWNPHKEYKITIQPRQSYKRGEHEASGLDEKFLAALRAWEQGSSRYDAQSQLPSPLRS